MVMGRFWQEMKRVLFCGGDQVKSCDDLSTAGNTHKRAKHSHATRSRGDREGTQLEPFIVDHSSDDAKKTRHDRRARNTPDDRKNEGPRGTHKEVEREVINAEINPYTTESQRKRNPNDVPQKEEGIVEMKNDIIEDREAEINRLQMEINRLKQSDEAKETEIQRLKVQNGNLQERLDNKAKHGTETDVSNLNRETDTVKTKTHKEHAIGELKRKSDVGNLAEPDNDKLRNENETLKYIIEDSDSEITRLKEEKDNLNTKHMADACELNNEIERLKGNIEDKDAKITKLNGEKEKLKSDNETINYILEDNQNELIKLKKENDNLTTKQEAATVDFNNEIERLKETIVDKETEVTKINVEKDKLEKQKVREIDELKTEIETLTQKLADKEAEQTKLKGDNDVLETQNKLSKTENDDLKGKIETLKVKLEDKETEITDLKSTNEDLASKYDELKTSCSEPLKATKVQIYCPGKIELSAQATSLFSERLRLELGDSNIDFFFCHTATDVSRDIPTVCLCVTVSRLGTDVVNAVQNVELNSDVVLVILHHKAAHSFPAAASRQVLVDKRYQSLAGMFDLVFEKNKLHECSMNETNMAAITDCLKRIMQKYFNYQ